MRFMGGFLVVGGGAREHALAWKLSGEPGVNEVTVAPGSYAIGAEPQSEWIRYRLTGDKLKAFAAG